MKKELSISAGIEAALAELRAEVDALKASQCNHCNACRDKRIEQKRIERYGRLNQIKVYPPERRIEAVAALDERDRREFFNGLTPSDYGVITTLPQDVRETWLSQVPPRTRDRCELELNPPCFMRVKWANPVWVEGASIHQRSYKPQPIKLSDEAAVRFIDLGLGDRIDENQRFIGHEWEYYSAHLFTPEQWNAVLEVDTRLADFVSRGEFLVEELPHEQAIAVEMERRERNANAKKYVWTNATVNHTGMADEFVQTIYK